MRTRKITVNQSGVIRTTSTLERILWALPLAWILIWTLLGFVGPFLNAETVVSNDAGQRALVGAGIMIGVFIILQLVTTLVSARKDANFLAAINNRPEAVAHYKRAAQAGLDVTERMVVIPMSVYVGAEYLAPNQETRQSEEAPTE